MHRRAFSRLAQPVKRNRLKLKALTAKAISYDQRFNYTYFEGDLLDRVRKELRTRAKAGGPVRFLDAGAGAGNGLLLAEAVSPNVVAHGLALHGPSKKLGIPDHKWTKGHFETGVFCDPQTGEGAFDVIQSRYALQHAANHAMALENLLNSLKVGGKLFNFHDSDRNVVHVEDTGFLPVLERQGFLLDDISARGSRLGSFLRKVVGPIFVNSPRLYVIRRVGKAKADLSQFYASARINKVPLTA